MKHNIAIFGGSFDPIHQGHVEMAKQSRVIANLTRVIFLPCNQSPHKPSPPVASSKDRAEMIQIALRGMSWATPSLWECHRQPPSYSWMAAEHFHSVLPSSELFWILGEDQWNSIHTWSNPTRLAELLTFIVFPRGKELVEKSGFRSLFIKASHQASSSKTRHFLANNKPTKDLLNKDVAAYIQAHQIYAPK